MSLVGRQRTDAVQHFGRAPTLLRRVICCVASDRVRPFAAPALDSHLPSAVAPADNPVGDREPGTDTESCSHKAVVCHEETFAVFSYLLTTTSESDTAYGARHTGKRRGGAVAVALEVGEGFLYHHGIFGAGDDVHGCTNVAVDRFLMQGGPYPCGDAEPTIWKCDPVAHSHDRCRWIQEARYELGRARDSLARARTLISSRNRLPGNRGPDCGFADPTAAFLALRPSTSAPRPNARGSGPAV
jgi:hypothetical protein